MNIRSCPSRNQSQILQECRETIILVQACFRVFWQLWITIIIIHYRLSNLIQVSRFIYSASESTNKLNSIAIELSLFLWHYASHCKLEAASNNQLPHFRAQIHVGLAHSDLVHDDPWHVQIIMIIIIIIIIVIALMISCSPDLSLWGKGWRLELALRHRLSFRI